jgi:hypothetical protein
MSLVVGGCTLAKPQACPKKQDHFTVRHYPHCEPMTPA